MLIPKISMPAWIEGLRENRRSKSLVPKDRHWLDRSVSWFLALNGIAVVCLLVAIGWYLYTSAEPLIKSQGMSFLWSKSWNPVTEKFGAATFVFGTVVSSLLAMLIAIPLSVGVALLLNELAPRGVARIVGFLVEMLAAIPSVVFGLWGIFALAPVLRSYVQPWLGKHFGFLPFFQGPAYGVGMMSAGIILAIMVIPTISSLCREIFKTIPNTHREAALALGATRWEMMKLAVLKTAKTGILGAVILGLGRAIGETMAVTMVIGNRPDISLSLFAPAQTMASVIANEYAEAITRMHVAALAEIGLVLFLVTFLMNSIARIFVWRAQKRFNR